MLAQITGTGSAFPQSEVGNDELIARVRKLGATAPDAQRIRELTGISRRRLSKPGDESEFNSALGARAALAALQMAGKTPADVDQILCATCTPDTLIPSTACWIQQKIGAHRAWAMDLNAACSGFLFALATAERFVATGHSRVSLVIGSDVLSAFTNWRDASSCILFGDGAGAVILESSPEASAAGRGILGSDLRSDGELWDLFGIEAGGSRQPVTLEMQATHADKMRMKGHDMFKVAVRSLAEGAEALLERHGIAREQIDWMVPHQANIRILEAVAKRLGVPMSRVVTHLADFGNTSAATIPTALDQAVRDGRIQPGQRLLLSAFGAGVTSGSMLLRW